MTAIRDAMYDDREQHGDALRLLEAAERGDVELGVPPQGSLADLRGRFGGELAGRVQALLARPGVVALPQVARLSDVTFPGEDFYWVPTSTASRRCGTQSPPSGEGRANVRATSIGGTSKRTFSTAATSS